MYVIYWLLTGDKTYIGFSNNFPRRLEEHRKKCVKSTKKFNQFEHYILERVETLIEARQRERYWKSSAGRKKLKKLYSLIVARSSSD
ncbi:GIY-YIG nuclease family protein [Candidatus Kuenenbacteria bacterium]|nr:GIY-YIG nuclease family protein [Candidatus Kuenenbacteria bacterium]